MNENNALIVGLGNVGRGLGAYSNAGNSHLSAIFETKRYKIYGTDILEIKDTRFTYISWEDLLKSDLFFDLVVDCGPSKERLKRLHILDKLFNPKNLLAEKPIELDSTFSNTKLLKKIRITYPRRKFDSTIFLIDRLKKSSIKKVSINYNNGVFNALSHFFDLLDCLGVNFTESYTKHNKSNVSIGDKIYIYKDNSKHDVFDIAIELNDDRKILYSDFGRLIQDENGGYHHFCELDYRYRNLYSVNNFQELPTIESEIKNISILNKLSELLND
jgi:hypothetical protein